MGQWGIFTVCVGIVFYHVFFVHPEWPDKWIHDLRKSIHKLPEREPDRCLPEDF